MAASAGATSVLGQGGGQWRGPRGHEPLGLCLPTDRVLGDTRALRHGFPGIFPAGTAQRWTGPAQGHVAEA